MKLTKICAVALAAIAFAACSNEDEISWNNAEATVSMGKAELVSKENKGIVNVPVSVDGKRNGSKSA